jgi:hypothetical protein
MRTLAIMGVVIGLGLSSPAEAQVPVSIPPSFELEQGDPSPCFVFACYNRSALDGDTLVAVGAALSKVYVWVQDEAGTWSQQAVLEHPDPSAPEFDQDFGALLAIDGDDLVVSGGTMGGLLVFHRSGTIWSHQQTLPSSSYIDLEYGTLVASDSNGFVVYERVAGGLFQKRATLKLPRFVDGYLSGPVELDRNTAVIAGGDDVDGAVFVFQRLFGIWLFVQKLAAPPAAAGGGFGSAVAIDHDHIAVGAPGVPGLDATRPGVVQTYARRGLHWRASDLLDNPVPPDGEYRAFGAALDLQGKQLLISASPPAYPYAEFVPANYLYELAGNSWAVSAVLEADAARAVELSGNRVLVDEIRLRYGTTPTVFDLP